MRTQLDLFAKPLRIRDRKGERELMRTLRAVEQPGVAGMTRREVRLLMRGLPKITVPR